MGATGEWKSSIKTRLAVKRKKPLLAVALKSYHASNCWRKKRRSEYEQENKNWIVDISKRSTGVESASLAYRSGRTHQPVFRGSRLDEAASWHSPRPTLCPSDFFGH